MLPRWMWLVPLAIACAPKDKAPKAAAEAVRVEPTQAQEPQPIQGPENGEMWTIVEAPDWAVAVPDGWVNLPVPDDRVKMLAIGDGINIPPVDETGEPLQAGIIVEVRRGPFASNEAIVETLLAELHGDGTAILVGEPTRQQIQLCDGRQAEFMAVGFVRPDENRKSMFTQVFVTDEARDGWVTSAYLVSGPDSTITDTGSLASSWMASHALSFCLDPAQFDEGGVRIAYNALEDAVKEAAKARQAIEAQDPTKTTIEGEETGPTPAATETPLDTTPVSNPVPVEQPEVEEEKEAPVGPDE